MGELDGTERASPRTTIYYIIKIGFRNCAYARHIDALTVWMENVPPHLHHVIVTDFGWFNKVSSAWFSKEKKKVASLNYKNILKFLDFKKSIYIIFFLL